MLLEDVYKNSLLNYRINAELKEQFWNEIVQAYSEKSRHYHNLNHLEHLYKELCAVKTKIYNWDAVLFALFYHDVIYDVHSTHNEAESAQVAEARLKEIQVPESIISRITHHIDATKNYANTNNDDTNYFVDADLSILGSSAEAYQEYSEKIRKEYAAIPDHKYFNARKDVLKRFLAMERIYKSEYFFQKYEAQARENLRKELCGSEFKIK